MFQHCRYYFTGYDQSKHMLSCWVRPSLSVEFCLYVNERLAATKWDHDSNILNETVLGRVLSYNNILIVYTELLKEYAVNGYKN